MLGCIKYAFLIILGLLIGLCLAVAVLLLPRVIWGPPAPNDVLWGAPGYGT